MYGDYFLIEQAGAPARPVRRLPLGSTAGRDEAWLRDLLFAHPEILPVADFDPSFAPLAPLCRELRTEVGPLDAAFINADGLLTLVECKLWRNPEARRKVIAQILDYAGAIARWSYSDLQRQVSAARQAPGNLPFEAARSLVEGLEEHRFVDAVTRHMHSGRFLLLIAGDGIREDIRSIAELVNRNSTSSFILGLVEIALYDLGQGALAVQPRIVARTQTIERTVIVAKQGAGVALMPAEDEGDSSEREDPGLPVAKSERQEEQRKWWGPVLDMRFDDPDQEPLKLYNNFVRAPLPLSSTWLSAYRVMRESILGVFLGGTRSRKAELWPRLEASADLLLEALPEGTRLHPPGGPYLSLISTDRRFEDFPDDDAARDWLIKTLNAYANVLRPLFKRFANDRGNS